MNDTTSDSISRYNIVLPKMSITPLATTFHTQDYTPVDHYDPVALRDAKSAKRNRNSKSQRRTVHPLILLILVLILLLLILTMLIVFVRLLRLFVRLLRLSVRLRRIRHLLLRERLAVLRILSLRRA